MLRNKKEFVMFTATLKQWTGGGCIPIAIKFIHNLRATASPRLIHDIRRCIAQRLMQSFLVVKQQEVVLRSGNSVSLPDIAAFDDRNR
jgi:hypothetical protein